MTLKTYREAIIDAMILEMKRDEKVFVIGEDISGGRGCEDFDGEAAGGPMGQLRVFGMSLELKELLILQ